MLNAEPMPSRKGGRPPVGNKLRKPVTIRLTDEEYEQLYAISKHGGGVTAVIRDAIRRRLSAGFRIPETPHIND